MSKKKGHGRRHYQPITNVLKPGVHHAYSWLFPKDAKAVVDWARDFDSEWFEQHPLMTRFARKYIPGEAYPQHDAEMRFVAVFRQGNTRARAFSTDKPIELLWVDVPDDVEGAS